MVRMLNKYTNRQNTFMKTNFDQISAFLDTQAQKMYNLLTDTL